MATEKFILKPVQTRYTAEITRFPSETLSTDLHLLVSDIIADDDATYLEYENTLHETRFDYNFPLKYANVIPTTLKIKCRALTTDLNNNLKLLYVHESNLDTYSTDPLYTHTFTEANVYEDILFEIPTDTIERMFSVRIKSTADVNKINCGLSMNVIDANAKGGSVRVTQLYFEAEYETDSSVIELYHKENGMWMKTDNLNDNIFGSWSKITVAP